jgi:hypothetical protein
MMEQLYADFTSKVLPKVSEGLMMTKEYFLDLFGRYIKYLIVTDLIFVALFLMGIGGFLWLLRTAKRKYGETVKSNEGLSYHSKTDPSGWGLLVAGSVLGIGLMLGGIAVQVVDISKAVFVPEIRIYEELRFIINRP